MISEFENKYLKINIFIDTINKINEDQNLINNIDFYEVTDYLFRIGYL